MSTIDSSKADISSSFEEVVPESEKETRIRRLKLYRAALSGDWKGAKRIYDDCEENIGVEISKNGDTALHIAAAAKRIGFVKELVKRMNENDLRKRNQVGSTALFLAAASGKVELAQEMMKKNESIAMVPDRHGTLPIHIAASLGHKEMVNYLYEATGYSLIEEHRKNLFITCIKTDLYDIALQLLSDYPDLATARGNGSETALHVLAQKPPIFSYFARQNLRGLWKSSVGIALYGLLQMSPAFSDSMNQRERQIAKFYCLLGPKDVENKRLKELQLVERVCQRVVSLSYQEVSRLIEEPRKLIFDAAERGNIEFLSILIWEYPDLIRKVDEEKNKYSIFHIAVKNRQEDVFNLIYEIGSSKEVLFMTKDEEDNNILHLAGMLGPQDRLNITSGEALQFQRELQWFKQVEKLVQQDYIEAKNRKGHTPRALFTEQHKDLREKGEKWMKDTATSCMVVAALVATVAFAAAITVPGGNNGDTGFPFFIEKVSFQVFAIADAISLVLSLTSIAIFLSILTSRYAEEDFLRSLPTKLYFGMSSLVTSLEALMVVFSATFFIFFNSSSLWIAIFVSLIAPIPIYKFTMQNFHLFSDILYSVFLFHPIKSSFFSRELEASDQVQKSEKNSAQSKFQYSCTTNV
ncbi:Ankyrin repeat family protein [Melia azedarach]|uniref:Ankyrin repeat family protein n=1 Tax=Melia azedarach TaxID=155640 RepID=A0ACC1WTF3_MELAZ|nr:Ankyrin repeat family protein [Melia azedarach]